MRKWAFALVCLAACKGDNPVDPGSGLLARVAAASSANDTAARPGDWVFADRIVIQDAGSSTGWGSYGGSIVDLAAAGAQDPLTEIFFQCELRAIAPTKASSVNEGGETFLEMSGEERGIPFLDAILPNQPIGIEPTLRYGFKDEVLTVTVGGRDTMNSSRSVGCGLVLIKSDAVKGYQDSAWIGAMSGTVKPAFVVRRKTGGIAVIAPQADVTIIDPDEKQMLRGGGTFEETYVVSLGNDLEEALARVREPSSARQQVTLTARTADLLASRRGEIYFEITDRGNFVTATHKNAALLPGQYTARAVFEDREVGAIDFEVASGPVEKEVVISGLGAVRIRATADGRPTPARVRIGNVAETYTNVDTTLIVPIGNHLVEASHGPEHEVVLREVVVSDGETSDLSIDIPRAFDTPGWIAADFHIHGTRSVDSQIGRELRVLGGIAEGLDVMVATDHDTVTDYSSTAQALGVASMIETVPGIEMSPLYGHINGFPLPAQKPEAYFKPSWVAYTSGGVFERVLEPVEIAQSLRALGAEIVQINHPRDGTGVFGYIGLDPATASTTKTWPAPDTFEIINGKRFEDFEPVFADMIGLLKNGKRATATGTSDIHDDLGMGFARTLIRADDPHDLPSVWRALREGRAIATSGPFLTITATAAAGTPAIAEIGDTLVAEGAVSVKIEAKAPSWMSVERVMLYENGVLVLERNATQLFSASYVSSTPGRLFFIAVLRGSSSGPEGKESLAVTNPIFVDRP